METAQNLPPQPPPQPAPAPSPAPAPAPASAPPTSRPNTKKRPSDISHFQNSPYYKMRATVRDLRPHVLEVLRTPDFRNCKAAEEIREKMKIFMDLYKEMTAETVKQHKRQNVSAGNSFLGETLDGPEKPPSDRVFEKHTENKPPYSASTPHNQKPEDSRPEGTYIVGGSAFGWNFITFPGNESVYCGRTKESFRSANPKSQKTEVPVSSPPP